MDEHSLPDNANIDQLVAEVEPLPGAVVKQLREDMGLTQKQFAKYIGVPVPTVATWERRLTNGLSAPAAFMIKTAAKKTFDWRRARREELAAGLN